MELFDEEALKKENMTIDIGIEINNYNNISNKMINLKNTIENEINILNQLFDKTIDELQKSYQKKYEKLLKEENDLKEDLQNKVTKMKKQFEINLSKINENIRINERINKGLKKLDQEKSKNSMIQILSYVSKLNISVKIMKKIQNEFIKSIKFKYIEENNKIEYEEYYINGMFIPKDIEFKDIKATSINISWKIDDNPKLLQKIDKSKIKFKVEIRKSNDENYKEVYQGNNSNFQINNLSSNTTYLIRICSLYKNIIGEWTEPQKVNTSAVDSLILNESNKEEEFTNKILEWSGYNRFELIYRGTRDGMTSNDYHNKCDNQGQTISLFKNDKNHIFGGYASISWTSNGSNKNAPNSFLFTLINIHNTQPIKFPNINDGKEVYHGRDFGPVFGENGQDFCSYSNIKEREAYSNFPKSFQDVLGKGKSIFTSDENNQYFSIKEIEVFKLFK